jgi:hypothetical protein
MKPLEVRDVVEWLFKAEPGQKLEYHRGYMFGPERKKTRLSEIRRIVWESYESGIVTLVQKRHGDCDYSYIAVAK